MSRKLRIAFAASELVPYVKTGGLADVAAALPKALGKLGHRVSVFVPRYGSIAFPPGEFAGSVHVPVDGLPRSAGFYVRKESRNVETVFVEHPPFFDRWGGPYGNGGDFEDNRLRFGFFARAVLEYFRSRGERPDLFHANDWQTGLLPVYLKSFYWDDPTLHRCPSVFTIHNIAYQGNFPNDTLGLLGLPWNLASREALEFHGRTSYLKGGVLFSEIPTTVSPQYARDLTTPALAYGFEGILKAREADFVGILNGVDYEEWDPAHDPHIAVNYTARDLSGKAACKADLLRRLGLPEEPALPLVGVVSRLVHQKGIDILADAWWDVVRRPLRLVVLGQGEPEVEAGLRHLAAQDPSRFAVQFGYDNALAHQVEAGADMVLMPSRFEPCGLTQMYSLRYGTVPIVRSTGGLVDTVEPWNSASGSGTGFRFDTADGTGLLWAIDQALAAYAEPHGWKLLQRNGMARDFSWQHQAREYLRVYAQAAQKA
ncbi:MAG: glycogen synthase GlgA [Vicinamibacteria bacterium]